MNARIYQTGNGYEITNCEGMLYCLIPSGSTFLVKEAGRIDVAKWKPSGRLVRGIPNQIKRIFFNLNKKQ